MSVAKIFEIFNNQKLLGVIDHASSLSIVGKVFMLLNFFLEVSGSTPAERILQNVTNKYFYCTLEYPIYYKDIL